MKWDIDEMLAAAQPKELWTEFRENPPARIFSTPLPGFSEGAPSGFSEAPKFIHSAEIFMPAGHGPIVFRGKNRPWGARVGDMWFREGEMYVAKKPGSSLSYWARLDRKNPDMSHIQTGTLSADKIQAGTIDFGPMTRVPMGCRKCHSPRGGFEDFTTSDPFGEEVVLGKICPCGEDVRLDYTWDTGLTVEEASELSEIKEQRKLREHRESLHKKSARSRRIDVSAFIINPLVFLFFLVLTAFILIADPFGGNPGFEEPERIEVPSVVGPAGSPGDPGE